MKMALQNEQTPSYRKDKKGLLLAPKVHYPVVRMHCLQGLNHKRIPGTSCLSHRRELPEISVSLSHFYDIYYLLKQED